MKRLAFLFGLVLLTAGTVDVRAQVAATADTVQAVVEIELRDGTRYVGTVIEESDTIVTIRTSSGNVVRIEKGQIVSRKRVRGRSRDGQFMQFDPNETRLMFSPTGRSLDKGSAYLSAYYVFFGFAAYGVTDRVTIGGGTWLIPQAFGEVIFVAPKVQVLAGEKSTASLGVFAGFAEGEAAGIAYGVYTRGQPDGAVTVGLGFGFANGEVAADPVLVLGGERRLSRRTKLVGETYLLPTVGGGAVFLGGIRFFGSGLAADLGLLGYAGEIGDDESIPAIPWVSFAYNFGR